MNAAMSLSRAGVVLIISSLISIAVVSPAFSASTTYFAYDDSLSLTKQYTVDDGGTTIFEEIKAYDSLGRVKTIEKGSQKPQKTEYGFDRAGNLTEERIVRTGSTHIRTFHEYDNAGRRTKTYGPTEEEMLFEHDLIGNVTKQRVLLQGTTYADTATEYDELNRVTKVTDPEGHYRESIYDSLGRLVTQYAYNSSASRLSQTRWVYDDAGRPLSVYRFLDANNTGAGATTNDNVSFTFYDDDGRVTQAITYNSNLGNPLTTTTSYDGYGRSTKTTDPDGNTEEFFYDDDGNITRRIVNDFDNVNNRTFDSVYDTENRLVTQIVQGDTDANDLTTTYAYDAADRRTEMIDPEGTRTTYTFDIQSKLTEMIEDTAGIGRTTQYSYDSNEGVLLYLKAKQDDGNFQWTGYTYDDSGRAISIIYPDSNIVSPGTDLLTFTYDVAGRQITRIDQAGTQMEFEYDGRGLLTKRKSGGIELAYQYDGLGRMTLALRGTSSNTDAVSETTFAYDDLSRLTSEAQEILEGNAKTLTYDYDQIGNRLSLHYEPGNTNSMTLVYAYDVLNRVTDIERKFDNTRGMENLVSYQYQGRHLTKRRLETEYDEIQTVHSTKTYLDYELDYDAHRRVITLTNQRIHDQGAYTFPVLAKYSYAYDKVGNRTVSDGLDGFNKMEAIDIDFAYDTLHRVTTADYGANNEEFTYDNLGNRVTYEDQRNSSTLTYANNKANEYTTIDSGGGAISLTYTATGNLQYDDRGYTYHYDFDNKLTQVDYEAGGGVSTYAVYAYDALGRRITGQIGWQSDPANAETLYYYHDGNNVVAEYLYEASALTATRQYVHGSTYIDERAVVRDLTDDGQDYYYLLKDLYSVAGLMDSRGALAEGYVYDTYGKVSMWTYAPVDHNIDGDVDASGTDNDNDAKNAANGGANNPPRTGDFFFDKDFDGDVDFGDAIAFIWWVVGERGDATEVNSSAVSNPYAFTGRPVHMLNANDLQVQDNRNRTYMPDEGRWLQRDPAGYIDGSNLYKYAKSNPLSFVDPEGKATTDCGSWRTISSETETKNFKTVQDRSFHQPFVPFQRLPRREIDFQVWTFYKKSIKIAVTAPGTATGVNDGTLITWFDEGFANLPDAIYFNGVDGYLCGKELRCKKECERSCFVSRYDCKRDEDVVVDAYAENETKRGKWQWWYGTTFRDILSGGYMFCKLDMTPGKFFSLRASGRVVARNPTTPFTCDATSNPKCK